MLNKDEVIGEVREIFADAVAGRDLQNIQSRLSVAATKLDSIAEDKKDPLLRFVVRAIDSIRTNIGDNPDKAHYFVKAISELANDNVDGAVSALDDFSVRDFLHNLSQG